VLRKGFRCICKKQMCGLLAAVFSLLLLSVPSFAQSNLGRIFGAVTDQSGGAVSGAAVSVIDVARGVTRPLVTDDAGQYDASSLTPGAYTVRVESKGFKIAEHTGIDVGVGKEVRVDMTLQPGEQTTTVTVTGDLPMINTSNAQLGGTLEQLTVSELPVEGRNYQYLAFTRPGIVMAPTEGQQDFSTDGMSVVYVLWLIDGVSDSNLFVGGPSLVGGAETAPAGGLDQQTILPLDAVQEVNMIESPGAEYGDKSGAHIDVGLKSGTNTFHGSATGFGRDTVLDAKNPFLTPLEPKAPLTLEQFSGSVGGPIKKDKLFFFADYEGQRYTAGVPKLQNEPTVADLSAIPGISPTVQSTYSIPDAIYYLEHPISGPTPAPPNPLSVDLAGCSALTTSGLGASVNQAKYTPAQLTTLAGMSASKIASYCTGNPLLNIFGSSQVPGGGLNSGQIVTDFFTHGGSDNGIIKIDYHPNDKNSFNWEWYSGGGNTTSAAFTEQYWSADFHTWANMGRAVWVWTPNATWLNEFRFGYDYGNYPDYSNECDHGTGPNYAALGFVDGARQCSYESGGPGHDIWGGFPLLDVLGVNPALAQTGGSITMQDNFEHYFTVLDNVSWTHGKHTFKFGGDVRLLYMNAAAMSDNQGTINFSTLSTYLQGVSSGGVILDGDPNRNEYVPSMALYIQDSWRVTPRITLNYGLRYEMTWPWTNPGVNPSAPGTPAQPAHLWGNFNGTLNSATDLVQETPGHDVYKEYPWNFGPRIGVAWDVFGDGKTVFHTGGSIMQNSAPRGIQVVYSGGAELNAVPTGFEFYDQANPGGFNYLGQVGAPPPANTIQSTTASFTGTGSLPFQAGTPVYPSGASTGAYTCGDGIVTIAIPGNPAYKPALCSPQVISPLYHMPYYLQYMASIQHAFTNNFTLDIAYVGNQGVHLDGIYNMNPAQPGGNLSGGCPIVGGSLTSAVEQCRRTFDPAYPFYGNMVLDSSLESANYNALQASVTQRLSHGLQVTPAFTWEHTLSDTTIEDPFKPQLSWGSSGNPIDFTITATYFVPNIKAPAQLLSGWELNSTVYMLSGPAATLTDSSDDISGTVGFPSNTGQADRWDIAGNPRSFKLGSVGHPIPCYGVAGSSFAAAPNCTVVPTLANMPSICLAGAAAAPTNPNIGGGSTLHGTTGITTATGALQALGCYVTGGNPLTDPLGALFPQAPGTFGNEGTGTMYGHGYRNWDFSVLKNWKLKERYGIQFRAEFFNILNRTLIYGAGGTSANSPSSLGQITSETDSTNPVIGNGVRKIQFGLKLSF
jgi:hypothetical protein